MAARPLVGRLAASTPTRSRVRNPGLGVPNSGGSGRAGGRFSRNPLPNSEPLTNHIPNSGGPHTGLADVREPSRIREASTSHSGSRRAAHPEWFVVCVRIRTWERSSDAFGSRSPNRQRVSEFGEGHTKERELQVDRFRSQWMLSTLSLHTYSTVTRQFQYSYSNNKNDDGGWCTCACGGTSVRGSSGHAQQLRQRLCLSGEP